MIVISGALVLVALVLLVIGLIGPSLAFVYASIGASLAAFGFLVVGILQRRKEEAVSGAPTSAAEIAAAIRTPETAPVSQEELTAAGGSEPGGDVLVVEGRPRYHVAGCRYLTGKDARTVPVTQARTDGFSACGVCKPDEALASAAASAPADEAAVTVTSAPATKSATRSATTSATKSATRSATKAPAKTARAVKAAPTKAPTRAAKAAPAKAARAAAPAKAAKAPAKAAKAATAATAKAPAKAAKKAPAKATKAAATKRTATKSPAKTTRSTRG